MFNSYVSLPERNLVVHPTIQSFFMTRGTETWQSSYSKLWIKHLFHTSWKNTFCVSTWASPIRIMFFCCHSKVIVLLSTKYNHYKFYTSNYISLYIPIIFSFLDGFDTPRRHEFMSRPNLLRTLSWGPQSYLSGDVSSCNFSLGASDVGAVVNR